MRLNVLDKGFVELLSHTENGDLLVINAARCSFDKHHDSFDDIGDTKLLNFLAREKHYLPFRHPSATVRIYLPIFVARQLGKHQVGFSWSEVSRRYVKGAPDLHTPEYYRNAAENVKQGSTEDTNICNEVFSMVTFSQAESALRHYEDMINSGVCPEQARMILPQSMYTTAVWTGTLLGWHNLTDQRTDPHAQLETREYAEALYDLMAEIFPKSWDALKANGR